MSRTKSLLSTKVKETVFIRVQEERLFQAVYTRHIPEIMRLVKKGISLNYVSPEYGMAPLHVLACRNDCVLGYRLMQCPGIDLNIRGTHSYTTLHLACSFNNKKFVQMLLQMGADPNLPDRMGQTALHAAVLNGFFTIICYLLRWGADVNAMDCFEETPLSISLVYHPNLLITKILCNEWIDLEAENDKSSLHVFFECILACDSVSRIDAVLLLLDIGVDINIRDRWTRRICLHFVAISGFLDLGIVLVQRGADLRAVDYMNRTPAKVAAEHENEAVADYFTKGYRPGNMMKIFPLLKQWVKKYRQNKAERLLAEEANKEHK